ncbi:MAG: acyltransferase [Burkholderiales bacterium]
MTGDPASSLDEAAPARPPPPARYLTLDAMRGVAALTVVCFHLAPWTVRSGYLAVDFFFLLSGFVIARTYGDRLRRGLGFRGFIATRAIRLFPLLAAGVALGLIRHLLQIGRASSPALAPVDLILSVVCNLAFLPAPTSPLLSPIDGPTWSLVLEMAANAAWALLVILGLRRWMPALVAISAVVLVWAGLNLGSLNAGYTWEYLHVGFARVAFSFGAGVFFARFRLNSRQGGWVSAVLCIALPALLFLRVGTGSAAYDLTFIFIMGPALFFLGASHEPPVPLRGLARRLGELSYPIYVIHSPLLHLVENFAKSVGAPRYVWTPAFLVVAVVLSFFLARYWDGPMRRKLTALSGARGAALPAG